jgi:hypothetical protein
MSSERQRAANRRNARKSTGPRSQAAKKRTSQNALRHGLTLSFAASAAHTKLIDKLARQIAGPNTGRIFLEYAREIAIAELDLARVRRVKTELIQRLSALGSLDPPQTFTSRNEELRFLKAVLRSKAPCLLPTPPDLVATMPTDEAERTAEAIRRALPMLILLDRYEAPAIARRTHAIRQLVKRPSKQR